MADPKVLVVGPAWVGDMVMANSLYQLLKRREPDRQIDVVSPGWSRGVIERMPEVTRSFELSVAHGELGWNKRRDLGRRLKRESYEQAIVLPRSAKAALVPWFAGVPRRTGLRGEWRYGLINDRRVQPDSIQRTVDKYCWLGLGADETALLAVPNPRLSVSPENQARLLAELGLTSDGSAVALMPGAEYGPAKQWPVDYFLKLGADLARSGREVWVLGSAKEADLGDQIAASNRSIRNLCGRTELADAIDLLGLVAGAVSNDSGLMHIAAAVGAPLVAIYGSSSPELTPPLDTSAQSLWLQLDCSPCFERRCPLKHYNCLRELGISQVGEALDRQLLDSP